MTVRRPLPHLGLLILLAVAEFMLTLDLSIVNVALPAIRSDLAFSESSLQWVVHGYALTFAGFLLLGGRAADLFGGRRVFLGALTLFTGASLASALATDPTTLVCSRFAQGLGAGVLAPTTLSILTSTYREPEARHRALAIWTAVAIGGGAVGGAVGGALTAGLSWRWIFFINVPIGAALLVLAMSRLPRSQARAARSGLDVGGALTVTGGLTALVWALIRSGESGWGSADVIGGLAAALALLTAFALIETLIAREPLVPFSIFRSRVLVAGNLLSFLSFVPVMATWFLLTLYLQDVRHQTAIETGLLFLPMSLAVVGGSQISFRLLSSQDARALFAAGSATAAAGLIWLAGLSPDTALPSVIAAGSLAMIGGGLMFAPITIAATSVAPEHSGLASGLLNTTRQVGGALGLAVLATIAAAHTADQTAAGQAALTSGYATAFSVGAAVFLASAILGAVALPDRLGAPPATGGGNADTPADDDGSPAPSRAAAASEAGARA